MCIPKLNKTALAAGVAVLCSLPAVADVITIIGSDAPVPQARVADTALPAEAAAQGLARHQGQAKAMLARSFADARLALMASGAPVTQGTVDAAPDAMRDALRRALGGRSAMLVPMGAGYGAFIGEEGKEAALHAAVSSVLGTPFAAASAYGEDGTLLFVDPAEQGSTIRMFPISAAAMAAAEGQPVAETIHPDAARARLAGLGLSVPGGASAFHLTRAGEGIETLSFSANDPPQDIARAMARDLGQDGTFEMGLPNGRMVQAWRESGPVSILALDRETVAGRGATIVVQYGGTGQ